MKRNEFDEAVPGLPTQPLAVRLLYCAEMLTICAVITDNERRRVEERIEKRFFREVKNDE